MVYVLMEYPESCGKQLMASGLVRYEDEIGVDAQQLLEKAVSRNSLEAVRLQWRLGELNPDEYSSENIAVFLEDNTMLIRLMNFLPETAELSGSQTEALVNLGRTLLQELQALSYREIRVVGHANVTGREGEEDELEFLSRRRAEILSRYLREAGLFIDSVNWVRGEEAISDGTTSQGRGRNRRVEIFVHF
jgi:outer membrane protein OmpA-like peptidoglycan-associated protein